VSRAPTLLKGVEDENYAHSRSGSIELARDLKLFLAGTKISPCNFTEGEAIFPSEGQELWKLIQQVANWAAYARGFTGTPGVEACAAKPCQMSHQLFRSPSKLCAGSRSCIQMAEPANRSPRLVKKTAFSNQSREALARHDFPLLRGSWGHTSRQKQTGRRLIFAEIGIVPARR
jgi:hypothetical protein